jgi:radical SAM protein with 4Fe4S-binding SPASM domain
MSSNQSPRGPYFVLELTPRCNNDCQYCYNVWKKDPHYPAGELDTDTWKKIIEKIKNETTSEIISFTGGEPMMRKDTLELVRFSNSLGLGVNLITNGTLLTEQLVKDLIDAGVGLFELPFLSGKPDLHNSLSGNDDAWKKVLTAISYVKKYGGTVVGVVVVTKKNIKEIKYTLETAVVLGLHSVMFNRFNPGGRGAEMMDELLPTAAELTEALGIAQQIVIDYGMPITCNIPIQPCIVNMGAFPYLFTGFCSAGTDLAYYGIDSLGNMRPCNHSPTILGSFLDTPYQELLDSPLLKEFVDAIPPLCEPCPSARTCQGGCKAAAQVCYGSLTEEEPFFKRNIPDNPMLWEAKQKLEEKKA